MNLTIKIKDSKEMRMIYCKNKITKRSYGAGIYLKKLSSNNQLLDKTNELIQILLNF